MKQAVVGALEVEEVVLFLDELITTLVNLVLINTPQVMFNV